MIFLFILFSFLDKDEYEDSQARLTMLILAPNTDDVFSVLTTTTTTAYAYTKSLPWVDFHSDENFDSVNIHELLSYQTKARAHPFFSAKYLCNLCCCWVLKSLKFNSLLASHPPLERAHADTHKSLLSISLWHKLSMHFFLPQIVIILLSMWILFAFHNYRIPCIHN